MQARYAPLLALFVSLTGCGAQGPDELTGDENIASTQQASHGANTVDGYYAAPTSYILAPGNVSAQNWRHRFTAPADTWINENFNDSTWANASGGFGTNARPGDLVRTVWNTQTIWMRRTFTLTSAQIPQVVFWGRWDENMDIWINGVLAASTESINQNPYWGWAAAYRYLGMTQAARNALRSGTNTIAVRARRGTGQYVDIGLAVNPLLNLPMTGTQLNSQFQPITDRIRQYMIDNVIPAGNVAIIRENKLVLNRGFGHTSKQRTTANPSSTIFRLASADKALTRNAIRRLAARGVVDPVTGQTFTLNTRVFPLLAARGLTLLPNRSVPAGVNDITVQQILDYRSGLRDYPAPNTLYQDTATTEATFTIVDGLRWLYSTPLQFTPGTNESYVSTGHMLLRYLLEVLQGGNIERHLQRFLMGPAGNSTIHVAHAEPADRLSREIWYATVEEPHDRAIGLDHFYALATTAEGFARYARYYDIDGDVLVNPTTGLWTAPTATHTRNSGGRMGGTWAYARQRMNNQVAIAMYMNIDGCFDPLVDEIDAMSAALPASAWELTGPALARNPIPAVGAAGVATSATLRWTAGSGATSHRVYFGTSHPLVFRGDITTTSWNPGTLQAGTTYYWRVDERNTSGTRTGTVWSFTTAGTAPGLATVPSPAQAATNIRVTPTLSWRAGANAASHDIYFGTASNPPLVANVGGTTTSFAPGTLQRNTWYTWRVDERNASGVTVGPIWRFRTAP